MHDTFLLTVKKIILAKGRDQETVKCGKKGMPFLCRQNTHDLLVGTISIGIPSAVVKKYIFFSLLL